MQNKSQFSTVGGLVSKATKSLSHSRHLGVFVVISLVSAYTLLIVILPQDKTTQVRFVETPPAETLDISEASNTYRKSPLAGSEYEEAVRLRQTAALGLAISLVVMSTKTQTGGFPRTTSDIIRIIEASKLLPPGVQIADGVISSGESLFRIAYSSDPFSFSVLGLPRSNSGSQLLFRFPIPASEPNSVLYFEATRDKPVSSLLETAEQLATRGWKIRHWRGDGLTLTATTVEALNEQRASSNP